MVWSHFGCDHIEGIRTDCESLHVISSVTRPVMEGPLLWFQRVLSPLDDQISEHADGISLHPNEDKFLLSEKHLFPVLWISRHDGYPIMIHLHSEPEHEIVHFINAQPAGPPIILCASSGWDEAAFDRIDRQLTNESVFWDIYHLERRVQSQVILRARRPVLAPPGLYETVNASERFLTLMKRYRKG